MTLEQLYYLSQIAAVTAILASLIAVVVQLRQSTAATRRSNEIARAQLTLEHLSSYNSAFVEFGINGDAAGMFRRAFYSNEEITADETTRVGIFMTFLVNGFENAVMLADAGLIDEMALQRNRSIVFYYMRSARGRGYWRSHRSVYAGAFVEVMDTLVADAKAAEPVFGFPGGANAPPPKR